MARKVLMIAGMCLFSEKPEALFSLQFVTCKVIGQTACYSFHLMMYSIGKKIIAVRARVKTEPQPLLGQDEGQYD